MKPWTKSFCKGFLENYNVQCYGVNSILFLGSQCISALFGKHIGLWEVIYKRCYQHQSFFSTKHLYKQEEKNHCVSYSPFHLLQMLSITRTIWRFALSLQMELEIGDISSHHSYFQEMTPDVLLCFFVYEHVMLSRGSVKVNIHTTSETSLYGSNFFFFFLFFASSKCRLSFH